ncbi:MAG: hypothetical protein HOK20_04370, partial [Alphaproteobacteria bacterium]|nr:hypothetical protein [Alphaproteobacteria bacterium]
YQHRLEKEGGSLYYSELREANREALEADEMRRKGKIARKHLTFETSLDTGVSDSDESYVDPDEEIVH